MTTIGDAMWQLSRDIEGNWSSISTATRSCRTTHTSLLRRPWEISPHLFQGRYKSALVDKENDLLELIRYVHLNPVRAGMVERADDYIWSSHKEYLSGEDRTGLINVQSVLSHFGSTASESIRQYRAFINSGLPSERIEIREQQFIGGEGFIESVSSQAKSQREQSADSRTDQQRVRLDEILRTASEISGLSEAEIRFSRGYDAVRMRHAAIWLARRLSGCTLGEIGVYFGGIRWQTVANAINRVDESKQLRKVTDDFLIKLEG
jgi:putative transposase